MADTTIEWATKSWNPVTGCTKVSQGCKNCYAERIFNRFGGHPFTEVKMHTHKLNDPFKWKKPQKIFVNSMSDLFHEDVTCEFIDDVFLRMSMFYQHTYLVLTKRPEKMFEYVSGRNQALQQMGYPGGFASYYPNVWLGVSVEDQATADERIPILLRTPAAVRWISAEPLLGEIDLNKKELLCESWNENKITIGVYLDWVVVGGESGSGARPMRLSWVRRLRDQCADTKTPFFFKQWGEWEPCKPNIADVMGEGNIRVGKKKGGRLLDGREWNEYPNQKRK